MNSEMTLLSLVWSFLSNRTTMYHLLPTYYTMVFYTPTYYTGTSKRFPPGILGRP